MEIAKEVGLEGFDPTGLLSAAFLRAIAKGDVDGVIKGAASLAIGQVVVMLLCVVM
jgi:hypothetical protein